MREPVAYQAILEEGRVGELHRVILRQGRLRLGDADQTVRNHESHELHEWERKGSGVVFGDSDNKMESGSPDNDSRSRRSARERHAA
jgi:hypothetical protein